MKRLIFICFILLAITSCEKQKLSNIYDDQAYAIGTIIREGDSYHYAFKVGNTPYHGKYSHSHTISEDLTGNHYLVIYKKSNPNKSTLNLYYPIWSEQEFYDLVAWFEEHPFTS
jgi:hypothetical protein